MPTKVKPDTHAIKLIVIQKVLRIGFSISVCEIFEGRRNRKLANGAAISTQPEGSASITWEKLGMGCAPTDIHDPRGSKYNVDTKLSVAQF